jgi:hypothetical protein
MHRAEKPSPEALLPLLETPRPAGLKSQRPKRYLLLTAAAISCCLLLFSSTSPACLRQIGRGTTQHDHTTSHASTVSDFRSCSIQNFQATQFPFLEGVRPITHDEFVARRQRLAQALLSDGANAFVVEPGKLAWDCREYSWEMSLICTLCLDRLYFLLLCEYHSATMGGMGTRRASFPHGDTA